MAFDYINEAFKKLNILEEDMFNTSFDGINKLTDFVENDDNDEDVVKIIDPDATENSELSDSYVGKVIINCNVCHSHIFEDKEDIEITDDGAVNADMSCPYCGESEGFVIVGEIAPFGTEFETEDEDVETNDTETDDIEEEDVEVVSESVDNSNVSTRALDKTINEDFKEVSITTEDQHLAMTSDENGKVTVVTEPVSNTEESIDLSADASEMTTEDETIIPVSDETETEIMSNNDVESEDGSISTDEGAEETLDTLEYETAEESEELDIEDVDEESVDELGESYLRTVYENVESFKTTDVMANSKNLIIEGVIKFDSGVTKKTGFIFEAKDMNSKGQLRFTGSNKQLTESSDAFALVGRLDNKKLFAESLKYNYSIDNNAVRGVVRRK